MSGKVTVIINPKTSEVQFEVNGVIGTKCEDITAALERDNEVLDKQYTEEYDTQQEMPDYVYNPMEGSEE